MLLLVARRRMAAQGDQLFTVGGKPGNVLVDAQWRLPPATQAILRLNQRD